jgi:hypothetical protein
LTTLKVGFSLRFPNKIPRILQVQFLFFSQELIYRFPVHFVRYAAVHGTYGGALGLFVETLAFCAFIGSYIIGIDADGRIAFGGVYDGAVEQGKGALYAATVCDRPFHTAFINCIIGAFWFAGAAIDTFFCYLNSHFFTLKGDNL